MDSALLSDSRIDCSRSASIILETVASQKYTGTLSVPGLKRDPDPAVIAKYGV